MITVYNYLLLMRFETENLTKNKMNTQNLKNTQCRFAIFPSQYFTNDCRNTSYNSLLSTSYHVNVIVFNVHTFYLSFYMYFMYFFFSRLSLFILNCDSSSPIGLTFKPELNHLQLCACVQMYVCVSLFVCVNMNSPWSDSYPFDGT